MSAQAVTGCAIKKGENDPPIKADSEYPTWLFELLTPEATVAELERLYCTEGLTLPEVGFAKPAFSSRLACFGYAQCKGAAGEMQSSDTLRAGVGRVCVMHSASSAFAPTAHLPCPMGSMEAT